MEAKAPEKIVSDAVINILRGLRFSEDPRVAQLAAEREAAENDYLAKLQRRRNRQQEAA